MNDIFKDLLKAFDPAENRKLIKRIYWEALIKTHGNYEEVVSNCCGAKVYEDTDLCSDCKEHCEKHYIFPDGFVCNEDAEPVY